MAKEYLNHAIIEVTSKCNLKCKHCYNWWRKDDIVINEKNQYKKIIRLLDYLLEKTTINRVVFTGGEPMLAERFSEMVLHAKMNGLKVNVLTNGTSDLNNFLQLMKMRVDLIQFSIHAFNDEVHDYITGKEGVWNKLMKLVNTALELKVEIVPVIVITKLNYQYIPELIERLYNLGLKRFMVNRYNIGGMGMDNHKEIILDSYNLRKTFKVINSLAEKYSINTFSGVCTPYCLLNPQDYSRIRFGNCPDNFYNRPLTFDADGNIRMCNHSPIIAGNIYKQSVSEIIVSDYVCTWNHLDIEFCKACKYLNECHGGCRAASEQIGKTLLDVDPIIEELNLQPIKGLS